MATRDVQNALRVKGVLIKDPTDISIGTTRPFGGTELGVVESIVAMPGIATEGILYEEFGVKVGDKVFVGEVWALTGTLRSFDSDMLDLIFPNTSVGTISKTRGIDSPGPTSEGTLLSSKAIKLLFHPDAPEDPAVLFYEAAPILEEAAELKLSIDEDLGFSFAFAALRDSSNRGVAVKPLEDMVL